MTEQLIIDYLAAGADTATMLCGLLFFKHHTRITKVETTLKLIAQSLKISVN